MRHLDDILRLSTLACWVQDRVMSQQNLSISHRECFMGGISFPPNTFSIGNKQTSLVCNSGKQEANALKLEIPSKYLIQYIVGEIRGNPAVLIN